MLKCIPDMTGFSELFRITMNALHERPPVFLPVISIVKTK